MTPDTIARMREKYPHRDGDEDRLHQVRAADIDELLDAAEQLEDFKQLKLEALEYVPGKMDATMRGDLVEVFAHALLSVFLESGGENYVEIEVMPQAENWEGGSLILSMRRKFGKEPAELVRELKEQLATVTAERLAEEGPVDSAWLQSVGWQESGSEGWLFLRGLPHCTLTTRARDGRWTYGMNELPAPKSRNDALTLMRLLGCGKEAI